jgi:Mor family transcriptional regulator
MTRKKQPAPQQLPEQDPLRKRLLFLQDLALAVSKRWKTRGRLSRLDSAFKELLTEILKDPEPTSPGTVELTKEAWKRRAAKRRTLTTAQKEEIKTAYHQGKTLKQLEHKYGVHFSTISRIAHGTNKPRGVKRKLSFAQAEEIRRRFRDENQSIAGLAHEYRVSDSSISMILQGLQYKH